MVLLKAIKIMKRYVAAARIAPRAPTKTETETGRSNVAVRSDISSEKQLAFFAVLPTDIVFEVMSYLNQQDCLTCMTVCHDWDKVIPDYTRSIWSKINIQTGTVHRSHRRRERCLGSHVKSVVVWTSEAKTMTRRRSRATSWTPTQDPDPMHESLQELEKWGCTNVQQLHLNNWRIHNPFINIPDQLKASLTHVTLSDDYFSISILPRILNMCPAITHFTAEKLGYSLEKRKTVDNYVQDLDHNTKLKCLRLVVDNQEALQLENVLRRCPDLRFFVTQYPLSAADQLLSTKISDLDFIFTWCPKITYLAINCQRNWTIDNEINPDDYANDNATGLRYLSTSNYKQFDQLIAHLDKNRDTLEQLSICNWPSHADYSTSLGSLQLPQMRILSCYFKTSELPTFISLLNRCPSLDTLEWKFLHTAITHDVSAYKSLNTMHHLRNLKYRSLRLSDEQPLMELLKRIPVVERLTFGDSVTLTQQSQLKPLTSLKSLSLGNVNWKHSDGSMNHDEALSNFIKCLTNGSNLEHIDFPSGQRFGRNLLRTVASLPVINHFHGVIDSTVREYELVEFLNMLNGSDIETLTLYNLKCLNREAFQALSNLDSLREINTSQLQGELALGTQVCLNGLLDTLCVWKNLESVTFDHVYFVEGDRELSKNAVARLIQKRNLQYEIDVTRTPIDYGISYNQKRFYVKITRSVAK